jgi:hypothetical protein
LVDENICGKMTKKCAICGNEKDLRFYPFALISTNGNPVPLMNCEICENCESRIIKNAS